ncbi:hypothetical protein LSH36_413g02099 [Paralvinella palmiformis]|uniref:Uncharacterized protein n=1 Tax=Paralvinella palmiformis TaxID=53620 RepID=A0AAD9JCK8_9ANNE|nr:hypothetical protein LSH36_413g02099 [Paralvinella palmiformis]
MRDCDLTSSSGVKDSDSPFGRRLRYTRRADIRKGVERVRRLEGFVRDRWYKMDRGPSRMPPAVGGKSTRLPPLSVSMATEERSDGFRAIRGSPDRDKCTPPDPVKTRRIGFQKITGSSDQTPDYLQDSKRQTKHTNNIYSQKAAFFYDGQVSTLRMPAWKPLPSLKDRNNGRQPDLKQSADEDVVVTGNNADPEMTEGYAFKYSFAPASNRTPRNTPRQLGLPLAAREPTVSFLSRLEKLLTSERESRNDPTDSDALSLAHTSDIEANMDDVSGCVSCEDGEFRVVPKEEDVSHDFMKLEGLVSGVYQRKPVNARRKCLVWAKRHRDVRGYSMQ